MSIVPTCETTGLQFKVGKITWIEKYINYETDYGAIYLYDSEQKIPTRTVLHAKPTTLDIPLHTSRLCFECICEYCTWQNWVIKVIWTQHTNGVDANVFNVQRTTFIRTWTYLLADKDDINFYWLHILPNLPAFTVFARSSRD